MQHQREKSKTTVMSDRRLRHSAKLRVMDSNVGNSEGRGLGVWGQQGQSEKEMCVYIIHQHHQKKIIIQTRAGQYDDDAFMVNKFACVNVTVTVKPHTHCQQLKRCSSQVEDD